MPDVVHAFPDSGAAGARTRNSAGSLRLAAAVLLLTLPFSAYPLAWLKPVRGQVPLWGEVEFTGIGVSGMIAAAVVLLFPGRLIQMWRRERPVRLFIVVALTALGIAIIQQIRLGGSGDLLANSLFFTMMPLAGLALNGEFRRVLPNYCRLLFLVLALFSLFTEKFTGLPGNWNWNLSLLAVTLPALFTDKSGHKFRLLPAVITLSVALAAFCLAFPELVPRGAIAGAAGAALLIAVLWFIPRRFRILGALIAGGLGIGLLLQLMFAAEGNADSRIELWRGALTVVLRHPLLGVGAGRFGSAVAPCLPDGYFFSTFMATLHPHPHSELLHFISMFGVTGALCLALLYLSVFSNFNRHAPVRLYLSWMFAALLIHGQFDVLLSTPLAGTLFLIVGGTLAAGNRYRGETVPGRNPAAAIRTAAAGLLVLTAGFEAGRTLRSTLALRRGELLAQEQLIEPAAAALAESRKIQARIPGLYLEAQLMLAGGRNPQAALNRLEEMRRLGTENYFHSNGLRARALALRGEYQAALEWFERELQCFPYSAFYSGLRLEIMRRSGSPPEAIQSAAEHYEFCMRLRGLKPGDFARLLAAPGLDDQPLVQFSRQDTGS